MTKDKALKMAIEALEDSRDLVQKIFGTENEYEYEINACKDALKNSAKKKQLREPQYAHAWLDKEDGSISLEYECEVYGVMEDDFFKYLGRIKLEVNDD